MVFSRELTEKELQILLRMQEWVKEKHSKSDSHDWSHIFSVVKFAIEISQEIPEKVDPFIVIAGALLHDIGKTVRYYADFHGLLGSAFAEEYLEALMIQKKKREAICKVIVRHTPTSGIPPETTEEKIVFDADCLDRLGFMGLLRGFIGKRGMSLQEILMKYIHRRQKDYAKLHFEVSKEIGMAAQQETEGFCFLVEKRLQDRLSSLEDLLTPELANQKPS